MFYDIIILIFNSVATQQTFTSLSTVSWDDCPQRCKLHSFVWLASCAGKSHTRWILPTECETCVKYSQQKWNLNKMSLNLVQTTTLTARGTSCPKPSLGSDGIWTLRPQCGERQHFMLLELISHLLHLLISNSKIIYLCFSLCYEWVFTIPVLEDDEIYISANTWLAECSTPKSIWTIADLWLSVHWKNGTKASETWFEITKLSGRKMRLEMFANWQPFSVGLNAVKIWRWWVLHSTCL